MYKKKSLGQHFLTNARYLRAVADTADIKAGEKVLEIGPGEGTLTRELLARGAKVVAIEKDHRLIPMLGIVFENEIRAGQLEIIEGDALEWETEAKPAGKISGRPIRPARGHFGSGFCEGDYKVVGNIPYYITGALLKKFLSAEHQPSTLVFLIQKEVAERIARSKKESILSLSIKAYGMPKLVLSVPRGAFSPAPQVDSAILAITNISRKNFANRAHEENFFKLVRAGFAQKRKLLRRNLEETLGPEVGDKLERAGIARNARAEDVPVGKWLLLSKN